MFELLINHNQDLSQHAWRQIQDLQWLADEVLEAYDQALQTIASAKVGNPVDIEVLTQAQQFIIQYQLAPLGVADDAYEGLTKEKGQAFADSVLVCIRVDYLTRRLREEIQALTTFKFAAFLEPTKVSEVLLESIITRIEILNTISKELGLQAIFDIGLKQLSQENLQSRLNLNQRRLQIISDLHFKQTLQKEAEWLKQQMTEIAA